MIKITRKLTDLIENVANSSSANRPHLNIILPNIVNRIASRNINDYEQS